MFMLPILAHRDRIVSALESARRLIVVAPPGTGKSTQIPQFFADRCDPQRQLIVLEPRRIAARALACRVAEELGGRCGDEVGYQVRFERNASNRTRILFQTYGTFLQQLQSDPQSLRTSIIAFDEFHERSLDGDVALAWAVRLAETIRPDLHIVMLSATLDTGVLQNYLSGCPIVDIPDQAFPVEIGYQPPRPQEPVDAQVDRGISTLGSVDGSMLVFLPGVYEIERTADRIADACRRKGFRLLRLHGRLPLAEQQQVLSLPAQERCVILSTNVAETSLTIPGVTAVIDSGLARIASYDGERERNTLYLGRITKQNAKQRAGRAGRTAPGSCLRLWSRGDETAMANSIEPESLRLDPAGHLLTLCNLQMMLAADKVFGDRFRLPAGIRLLSPPPIERWMRAHDELVRCKAVLMAESPAGATKSPSEELPLFRITKTGRTMARLPVEPAVAAVLLLSETAQEREINTAMASLWESGPAGAAPGGRESRDLFEWALEFLSSHPGRGPEREAAETFAQLERMLGREHGLETTSEIAGSELRKKISVTWMAVFAHRIAAQRPGESVYSMREGRSGRLVSPRRSGGETALPRLILALAVHEQAGRDQARKITIPLYLPIEPEWVEATFVDELRRSIEFRWDEQRKRVIAEEAKVFQDLAIERREIENPVRNHRERVASCLAEQLSKGIWDWQADDPKAVQYACRVSATAAAYPEMNIPKLTGDDWELIFHQLCEGKSSLAEVQKSSIIHEIRDYIGPHLARFVEAKAPEIIMLPKGRKGRVTWFTDAPPELSARLGDLIGYPDRFMLMDGRLGGVFNILAPNFRTVQKTADLGSFWKNTYPAIKRELQRKYPKHPWP